MCYVLFSWQADSNDNKRKNEMDEQTRQDIIKSMIRTYYLIERNMQSQGGEITRQLDIEFDKLMTKEEIREFYDSNQYQGVPWDVV